MNRTRGKRQQGSGREQNPRQRSPRLHLLAAATSLAAAAWVCGGCDEEPSAQDGAVDAAPEDGRAPDSGRDAGSDASVDVEVPPDAVQHHFCNEAFFKLPIDGQTEKTIGIHLYNEKVVWSKQEASDWDGPREVYLLDLESCIERTITRNAIAGFLFIRSNEVVWEDSRHDYSSWCTDLYRYDLEIDAEERLTQTPQCELAPKTNGRYIAYRRKEDYRQPSSLRLMDRQGGTDIELSPYWGNVDSFDINDRYVVWAAYTDDPQSVGRDVFYRDLQTGQTHHIDATYPRFQYYTFLWEDWVTIGGSDAYLSSPTYLELYNLATREARSLVEGDHATSSGVMGQGLVSWNTTVYSGTQDLDPSDIEVYEIASSTSRRLTSTASNLRARGVSMPYLLFMHRLYLPGSHQNDYYIANLEALGVVDASGVLQPGAPVIDPP